MIERRKVWTVIAMLILAVACTPGEKSGAPEQAPAEIEAVPPASVLIAQRVADYDAWKRAFDDHQYAREDASCLGHYLKRGIDEANRVYVYCLAADAEKLREFLDSRELAEAMKRAGVTGEPEITLMKPMSRNLVPEQMLPGIIVMHPVEDYDAWRTAYDEFDDFRRQSGIVGHAVSRELDNSNHVIVYHQAEDADDLRAFVDSAELRDVMQHGGVVGEPEIHFIQVVGFAKY